MLLQGEEHVTLQYSVLTSPHVTVESEATKATQTSFLTGAAQIDITFQGRRQV